MSGSIADKIEYLQGTKEAIANAIIEQGVEVTEQDTFRSYAAKISQLGSPIKSVANTNTTNLILDESGQLTSNVNISSAENNLITINEDGLFLEASTVKTDAAAYIIESYIDGENGYRVWNDGICEQWCYQIKKVGVNQNINWTFLKPLKAKPNFYSVIVEKYHWGGSEFMAAADYINWQMSGSYGSNVSLTQSNLSFTTFDSVNNSYFQNFYLRVIGSVQL